MNAPESPRRRWRHSHQLNVLLVIAIIAAMGLVWLGWQVTIVRHRRAMLKQIVAGGATIFTGGLEGKHPMWFVPIRSATSDREIPRMRFLLGDESVNLIRFNRQLTAADNEAIKAIPEAEVQATPAPTDAP